MAARVFACALGFALASACERAPSTVRAAGVELQLPHGYKVLDTSTLEDPPLLAAYEPGSSMGTSIRIRRRASPIVAIDDATCATLREQIEAGEATPTPADELPTAVKSVFGLPHHRDTVHAPRLQTFALGAVCLVAVGLDTVGEVPWTLHGFAVHGGELWTFDCSGDGPELHDECARLFDGVRFVP